MCEARDKYPPPHLCCSPDPMLLLSFQFFLFSMYELLSFMITLIFENFKMPKFPKKGEVVCQQFENNVEDSRSQFMWVIPQRAYICGLVPHFLR